MTLAIGVDVGGTKIAAGLVDPSGRVHAVERQQTPTAEPAAVAAAIAALVDRLRSAVPGAADGGAEVSSVGIGAAGWIDQERTTVLFAPNLAWRHEPLPAEVSARIGLPVVVENDANAWAWAEHRFGAGRGRSELVCLTVGTGIGCGLILNGQLYRGGWGIAGEAGHLRVVPDGQPCGCGNAGCWEQYASGRALTRHAQELARRRPEQAELLLASAGGDVEAITGPLVTAAAGAGDPVSREAFAVTGRWLGQGMADLAAVLDPECFVVGGGVAEAGDLLLEPARAAFAAALTGAAFRPRAEIVPAQLGAAAGLVGAADLSRRPIAPPILPQPMA